MTHYLPDGAIGHPGGNNIDRDPLGSRRKLQTGDHVLTGHVTNKPAIYTPEFHDASIFNGAFLKDVIHWNTEEKMFSILAESAPRLPD